jgi:O-antigen/teichoic acid export membrane protein
VPLIILANFFWNLYEPSVWYKLIDKTYIGAYIYSGAALHLVLNLLIPTMSYYGSAIATIAAYGSMMTISYYGKQILSHTL